MICSSVNLLFRIVCLRNDRLSIQMRDQLGLRSLCRKHGISSATFYGWKAKFGGMDVSDAKRPKVLEDENAKLKRLLAEAMQSLPRGLAVC